MIVRIPKQRQFKSNPNHPFNDLVAYMEAGKEPGQERQQERSSLFDDILNYTTDTVDKSSDTEKCIAMRTSGVNGLVTASIEMNAVAKKNTRCLDPAYHFILSWPEHEKPHFDAIFDAAQHALSALNLKEHQYVLAIHGNTDNMHCHICVNRVHPETLKAQHIEWATKTLHRAARESEIKHGWSHDNGIYVVEIDAHGNKQVVPRVGPVDARDDRRQQVHPELGSEEVLPAWHDPGSLESWLKTKVARALKPALGELTGWPALHAWLSDYNITLSDSGGGGMRLRSTSPDSGEILDLAASKGLRLLKRDILEKRWGPFANSIEVACVVPDLSHLTPGQLAQGVKDFLARAPQADRPPAHIIAANQAIEPEPDAQQATELTEERQADASGQGRAKRDDLQREQRKAQRAVARAELRKRFASDQQRVRAGDQDHFTGIKSLQIERRLALNLIRAKKKAAISDIPKDLDLGVRFICVVEIDAESLRRELEVQADFQKKSEALRARRTPPLSWRAWLFEQSSLGDQAALSALRGIVYQAQRDAKRDTAEEDPTLEGEILTVQAREKQFRKVMARLLEEEKKEAAIRSANSAAMRPYQADALLVRYIGLSWQVTGNGNVEYRDQAGLHLFTDRGNRVTFDRERVSDDEICLALAHAQQKFGLPLTLTGEDTVFTDRMARLADDMGIAILNPELRLVVENHRIERQAPKQGLVGAAPDQLMAQVQLEPIAPLPVVLQIPQVPQALTDLSHRSQRGDEVVEVSRSDQAVAAVVSPLKPEEPAPTIDLRGVSDAANLLAPVSSNAAVALQALLPQTPTTSEHEAAPAKTPLERLRAMVLAIDPNAKFVTPASEERAQTYFGKVVASLGETAPGIAQFSIRLGAYLLHPSLTAPAHEPDDVIEVQYKNGQVTAKNARGQGKGGRGG